MEPAVFEDLQRTLNSAGPAAAIDRLCTSLRDEENLEPLFYARLLAARQKLDINPIPTAPISEIPDSKQDQYEEAIRLACREVGQLCLERGQLPQAFGYYRMIGETEPVRKAMADHVPREDEDMDSLIRITLYEGLLPRKGFDWVIERFGICSAITTISGQLQIPQDDRRYCVGRIVRNLFDDLCDRVGADVERTEGKPLETSRPHPKGTLRKLIAGRPWLFGEDSYHIDLSHLSSTVQMSLDLEPGEELELARELCAYGQGLSDSFKTQREPPFDEPYRDHDVYLGILMGDKVDEGLAHFRAKADVGTDQVGTGPAEVLVRLLQRLGRHGEALQLARKHLVQVDNTWLTYLADLCRQANDYRPLADAAREQGNAVQFIAGLLASRKG
jgi:hypothetical protein